MIYQYECPGDGEIIEIQRRINDPEEEYLCITCGAKLRRIFNAVPITFHGKGFYTTDK